MIDVMVARQLWLELHTAASLLKDNQGQKTFMSNWFMEVEAVLGCTSCWRKVKRFCKLWPPAYGKGLWLWSICLHDYVNKELGKGLFHPSLTLTPLFAKGILQ